MPVRPRSLRVGDAVRFDERLHTVTALEGTTVRLVDEHGSASVVLLPHLLASDGFMVVTAASPRMTVPAAGALEGLPGKAVERAEWWQRHLVELLTGRPAHAPDGPRGTPTGSKGPSRPRSSKRLSVASFISPLAAM
ncbi:hypothetical protein ACLQ2N_34365 [Streptomyces sp. DT224]|uniref:hypothetical protein n=1 Tax=Streptomyces sp. DT224 TaxID=3393426 RepID=UPI003CE69DAB